jgi:hypothetical protein
MRLGLTSRFPVTGRIGDEMFPPGGHILPLLLSGSATESGSKPADPQRFQVFAAAGPALVKTGTGRAYEAGVTIHIGLTRRERGTTVRVDGWLEGDEADELLRVVGAAELPVVLDLLDLRSADEPGIRALCQLEQQGVRLTGTSDYLELLMEKAIDNRGSKIPEGAEVK